VIEAEKYTGQRQLTAHDDDAADRFRNSETAAMKTIAEKSKLHL